MSKIEDMIVLSFFVDDDATLSSKIYMPESTNLEMIASIADCISSIECPYATESVISAIKDYMLNEPSKIKDCLQLLNSCNISQPKNKSKEPCVSPTDVFRLNNKK